MTGASLAQGWRVIKKGFRAAYDYAGTVMIISTMWAFLGFFPAMLTGLVLVQTPLLITAHLMFAFVCVVLLGPLTAAVYSICDAILDGQEVRVRDYWSHFTRHYKKSFWVTAVMFILIGVLIIDVIYFWQVGTTLMQLISVLWLYLILFWFMMMQHVYALVVRRSPRLIETLKMSALLALDNIVVTLMVGLAAALVMAVSYLLRVPMMLFMIGTLGFLHAATLHELLGKYRAAKES